MCCAGYNFTLFPTLYIKPEVLTRKREKYFKQVGGKGATRGARARCRRGEKCFTGAAAFARAGVKRKGVGKVLERN